MRLIVPYTNLRDETREAISPYHAELTYVGEHDEAYWNLLSGLWAAGEDFMIVEQDITVRPTTVESFDRCDRPWCCAPYRYLGSLRYAGLGCARFRADMMRAVPDLLDVVAERVYPGHSRKHWCTLDAAIQHEMAARGVRPCLSHAPVGHRDGPPSHGCC